MRFILLLALLGCSQSSSSYVEEPKELQREKRASEISQESSRAIRMVARADAACPAKPSCERLLERASTLLSHVPNRDLGTSAIVGAKHDYARIYSKVNTSSSEVAAAGTDQVSAEYKAFVLNGYSEKYIGGSLAILMDAADGKISGFLNPSNFKTPKSLDVLNTQSRRFEYQMKGMEDFVARCDEFEKMSTSVSIGQKNRNTAETCAVARNRARHYENYKRLAVDAMLRKQEKAWRKDIARYAKSGKISQSALRTLTSRGKIRAELSNEVKGLAQFAGRNITRKLNKTVDRLHSEFRYAHLRWSDKYKWNRKRHRRDRKFRKRLRKAIKSSTRTRLLKYAHNSDWAKAASNDGRLTHAKRVVALTKHRGESFCRKYRLRLIRKSDVRGNFGPMAVDSETLQTFEVSACRP